MEDKTRIKKSKYLSLILRHKPELIGLTMDKDGWCDIAELLTKMNDITKEELFEIVKKCEKQRYEIHNDKIRARQGHSINLEIKYDEIMPPDILFHGTTDKFPIGEAIKKMGRHHVHMSGNIMTAITVGKRKGTPIIAIINAKQMFNDGIKFYLSSNNVWLTDIVENKYINFMYINQKVGCGGFIIYNMNKTKCLLVKAKDWGFPKGKKHKTETLFECAIRELNEETSIELSDILIDYLEPIKYEKSANGNNSVGLYTAYVNENVPVKIKDLEELEDIKWFDISDAKELLKNVKNRSELI